MTKWIENEHAEAEANLECQRQAIASGGGSVSELDYAIGYLDAITNARDEASGITEYYLPYSNTYFDHPARLGPKATK